MAKNEPLATPPEVIFTGLGYQGYCVKCKEKREIIGNVTESPKNGSKIAKGDCPECGTTVCRILGKNWTPESAA